jgi:adenylosuccinate lyase
VNPLNPNVLSKRYATGEINHIFSDEGKVGSERDLWIAVLSAQKKLGLDIPEGVVEAYTSARDNIDLGLINEIELRTKHDVKARIEAFNQAAGGHEFIHLGMTSRDLTDNVEQLQIMEASRIIHGKYVSVLRHMLDKAKDYRGIELTARTHHQPAQTTLLGRRFSMWAEELYLHLMEFEVFIENYPLRGIKGPVGTQFDMGKLLGSREKALDLEVIISDKLGFKEVLNSPGQVYPRSLDYKLISQLAALTSACENFAKTIRLMAGYELVTEGFRDGQVGSSIMPHKMNTRSTERVCALSELVKMYADGASRLAGDQWEEGDVSCSAIRRVLIPDAFYASDGIVETTLNVLNQMGTYPAVISKEVDRYLPFLATTEVLAIAVKSGIGREEAHSIIKKHAIAEALGMRELGASGNRLMVNLASEPLFKKAGITEDSLNSILLDKIHFVGNANSQIDAVIKKCWELIERHKKAASYEPGDIL